MTLVFFFGKNAMTVSFVFVDVTGLAAGVDLGSET